jgi:RHS repeat-associated protein
VVAEYRYNGLGYRIGWHYDVNLSGGVTSADPWYYFAYDERWRIVATYLGEDPPTTPKERFVYHNGGFDGLGGSSYIDALILRDRDNPPGGWGSAPPPSDGILEERRYYCQNWRSDVVAVVTDTAQQVEHVRYSSYGIPIGLPAGDADSDGDTDAADLTQINSWITCGASCYDVRGDINLDGCVSITDRSLFRSGMSLGWGVLTRTDTLNRKGYAGYEFDPALQASYRIYHVRHRPLNADLGQWMTRDPIGYADGASLYQYLGSHPLADMDPSGLSSSPSRQQLIDGPSGRRPHEAPRPPPGYCVPRPTPCARGGGGGRGDGLDDIRRCVGGAYDPDPTVLYDIQIAGLTVLTVATKEAALALIPGSYVRWAGKTYRVIKVTLGKDLVEVVLTRDLKRLRPKDIKALIDRGKHPHTLKPNSTKDLYRDKEGNVYVGNKDGSGEAEPIGEICP